MRIHTDTLTKPFLGACLHEANLSPDVWLEELSVRGSRSRRCAFEVRLAAHPGTDRHGKRRRPPAAVELMGRGLMGATYDEWGDYIAAIFRRDPDAIVGPYKGVADFHAKTDDRYR